MIPSLPAGGAEFELLLCCARISPNAETTAQIKVLLQKEIDWQIVVSWALWHGTMPLLYRNLTTTCAQAVPEATVTRLRASYHANARRNVLLARQLLKVMNLLDSYGIQTIPLKGPVLALAVYGELGLRQFSDLDLLIRPGDVPLAHRVLSMNGYLPENCLTPEQITVHWDYQGQYLFTCPDINTALDLHWEMVPRTLEIRLDSAELWERAEAITCGEEPVLSLATEDLLLFLSVHGSKEQWSRLKWVCDVAELIRARPTVDWQRTLKRARAQGGQRMLFLGLRLANLLLGATLPPEILRTVRTDRVTEALTAAVQAQLQQESRRTPGVFEVSMFRCRMRERLRDRALYLLRTIATPRSKHIALLRLPISLFFLYYPIKLVHDYLLVPIWRIVKRGRRQSVLDPEEFRRFPVP